MHFSGRLSARNAVCATCWIVSHLSTNSSQQKECPLRRPYGDRKLDVSLRKKDYPTPSTTTVLSIRRLIKSFRGTGPLQSLAFKRVGTPIVYPPSDVCPRNLHRTRQMAKTVGV